MKVLTLHSLDIIVFCRQALHNNQYKAYQYISFFMACTLYNLKQTNNLRIFCIPYSCRHMRIITEKLQLLRWSDIQGQRLYRGQNSNLNKFAKSRSNIFLFSHGFRKYSLTHLLCINHELLAKRSKVTILSLQGSNLKKMYLI